MGIFRTRANRPTGYLLIVTALIWLPAAAFGANHVVTLQGHSFNPKVLTIQAGDRVIWQNTEGFHNVRADDGSFRCAFGCDHLGGNGAPLSAPWSVSVTFDNPGEVPYHCQAHRVNGMTGTIIVKGDPVEPPPPSAIDINFGHGGSWYNQNQDGQGFSLEVVPDDAATKAGTGTLVAYWFSFAKGAPGGTNRQRWYQGVGPIDGAEAVLDVYQVTGGVFDDPTTVASEIIGTATVSFESCTAGTLAYSLDLDGNGSEESANAIALTRLTPDVLCEDMAAR